MANLALQSGDILMDDHEGGCLLYEKIIANIVSRAYTLAMRLPGFTAVEEFVNI